MRVLKMPERKNRDLFENIAPILHVKNLAASIEYYENVLGFERAEWVTDDSLFGYVGRDGFGIYLSQDGQGNLGTWLWIGLKALDPLYEEFQAAGANIVMEPTNFHWALEMRIEDPDGHVIRFGTEPRDDLPFVE
jgi:uncharacterized glyoxalase superfamily protein PhnB